jgi:hypothetical protein
MTEKSTTQSAAVEVSKPLTQLEIFFIKLSGITAAAIIFFVCSAIALQSLIEAKIEEMPFLKGGRVFWEAVEKKVDAFANGNDLSPEKKAKIIASLRKISDRYRPYFEAAGGAPTPR